MTISIIPRSSDRNGDSDLTARFDRFAEKVDAVATEMQDWKRETSARLKETSDRLDSMSIQLAEVFQLLGRKLQSSCPMAPMPFYGGNSHPIREVNASPLEPKQIRGSNDGLGSSMDSTETSLKNMDMPIFDGSNASVWFDTVECLFNHENYTDAEKLDMISLRLTGRALIWHNWEVRHVPYASWEEFKKKVLRRFGLVTQVKSNLIPEKAVLLLEDSLHYEESKAGEPEVILKESIHVLDLDVQSLCVQESIAVLKAVDVIPEKYFHEKLHEKGLCDEAKLIGPKALKAEEESSQKNEHMSLLLEKEKLPTLLHEPEREVPISTLESSHRSCNEPMEISEYLLSANERNCRSQFHIGMQCVNGKKNADNMLEQMLMRRYRFYQLKKMSKSPKSWMFKFKTEYEESTLMFDNLLCDEKSMLLATISQEESKFRLKNEWKFKPLQPVLKLELCLISVVISEQKQLALIEIATFQVLKVGEIKFYEYQLLDTKYGRVQSKRKQRKYPKNWRFKYKNEITHKATLEKKQYMGLVVFVIGSGKLKFVLNNIVKQQQSYLHSLRTSCSQTGGYAKRIHMGNGHLMMLLQGHTQMDRVGCSNKDAGLEMILCPLAIEAIHILYFSSWRVVSREEVRNFNESKDEQLLFGNIERAALFLDLITWCEAALEKTGLGGYHCSCCPENIKRLHTVLVLLSLRTIHVLDMDVKIVGYGHEMLSSPLADTLTPNLVVEIAAITTPSTLFLTSLRTSFFLTMGVMIRRQVVRTAESRSLKEMEDEKQPRMNLERKVQFLILAILFTLQEESFSIWHRWRVKDQCSYYTV